MTQPLNYLKETPSQTAGPYVHIGLAPRAAGFDIYDTELGFDPMPDDVPGPRIRVTGCVFDGTVLPGAVPGPRGRMQAPHLSLWLVARGINTGLQTRMYFADQDNAADPVLSLIEQPHRRDTLIARGADGHYHFDIHLQGDKETVFLDV